MIDGPACAQVVILADESADWQVAGLRQIHRLLLALNEFAPAANPIDKLEVSVFWKPDPPLPSRSLPNDQRFACIRVMESLPSPRPGTRILSTHLFVYRNALRSFFAATAPAEIDENTFRSTEAWQKLADDFEKACQVAIAPETGDAWRLIARPNEITAAETEFLRHMGKPQDGLVSQWINRPLTRQITRLLLRFPITPTAWTLSIFPLPILASAFLYRSHYVAGTAIYQLYSMLDGCDGEIARAKYLESQRGGKVDDLCDLTGALLFVVALGFGLGRFYAAEGILLGALIAANEWFLRIPGAKESVAVSIAAYPRHRQLLQTFGQSPFGEKCAWCVLQLTKRDVGILFFLLLALCGFSQWILHPWLLVTVMTLLLNAVSSRKARA